ncbi:alpha-N-acetylglucosaminidase [Pontibacter sp. SGAir0037]|uniref:alpha-N-acetylglucosaminidase n=1 Tax=Pontibacter sp. SGAir0037 TaxID=2571030 RepID=UPI0010CCEC57|nr:alpha-N-acetylglucosaminidase [Pontibacter sp. SGAir0037]QCR22263.1 alpha-N-acetylglucosaminidase [Pontibacter sp. SGAir0037]
MRPLYTFLAVLVLFCAFSCSTSTHNKTEVAASTPDSKAITAARGVMQRLIGDRANNINLEIIAAEDSLDTYEVEAVNGELTVRGSSAVALTFGFYQYLKKGTLSMVSWSGNHLNLPDEWPDYPKERATSPYKYRYFLNVVTYGYTTPYWDWERWQKEIDWMALHGVNMPLALVGSEAIAERVWKKLGLSNEETREFFTGPAHLPWHRMGNINKWDGPIPDGWHEDQLKLQHQILDRMHELGFEPIAPAFAGFVPEGFKKLHPELEVNALKWGGFPAEYNAYVLPPNSPYFEQIGKLFVEEWEKEFGKNKLYLSDSFNEMDVPVPKDDPEKKYALLAGYGEAIYKSVVAGNPDAVWVTQGWTFGWQHEFWDKKTLSAMMSKVPDDKMIILDLANEYPDLVWKIPMVWKEHEGYYGKQWVYSYVPNFGGKTPYTGVLSMYASGAVEALNSPYSKTLIGFGSAPEGIENNEVVYELLADMGWSHEIINLDQWLKGYSQARYGAYPDKMKTAWEQLRESVYSSFSPYPRFVWQTVVPDTRRKGVVHASAEFLSGVEHFLAVSEELSASELYRNDAIELSMLYLGIKADEYYQEALEAKAANNTAAMKTAGEKAINILQDIDRLLESHPTNRLQPWVDFARSHGTTAEQKNYYEANSKRLITTWGGTIEDYAARLWSGMIRDYYIPRIRMHLFEPNTDLNAWEEAWIQKPGVSKAVPFNDPLAKAKELVAKHSRTKTR